MKKLLGFVLATGLLVALLTGCGGNTSGGNASGGNNDATPADSATEEQAAPAAGGRELSLSIGNPEGSDNYYKYKAFADKVGEVSGGALTVKIYASGTLATDQEALEALMSGTVDFAHLTPAVAGGTIKDVAAMDLPGVFSYESQDDMTSFIEFEAKLHDTLDSIYADYNLKYLATNQSCQAVIIANDVQVKSPADLKGKAYRTSGQYLGKLLESWGASATSMDMSDLTTAFERNMIQGTLTAYGVVGSNKLYEVAPYVTYMNTTNSVASLIMNGDTWNSLSEEEQGWIEEAAAYYLEEGQKVGQQYYTQYRQEFEDGGASIYDLTPEEEAEFLAGTDAIFDEIEAGCTEKGVELINLIKEWNAK